MHENNPFESLSEKLMGSAWLRMAQDVPKMAQDELQNKLRTDPTNIKNDVVAKIHIIRRPFGSGRERSVNVALKTILETEHARYLICQSSFLHLCQ